jgi:DNA-binding IclR family transcriptional regulator
VSWVGRRTPLHATASGKALLAFAEPDEQSRMLSAPLTRCTRRTIVSERVLQDQLRTVRSRGYAQTFEELEEGLNAIAAPVRQADRRVVAALSVSGPAFRLRAVDFVRLGRLTLDAATAISRRLGFTGSLVD